MILESQATRYGGAVLHVKRLAPFPFWATSSDQENLKAQNEIGASMKISIIGSGRIGGLVGNLWAQAGHQVRFSSRHPDNLDALVAASGPIASRSSIEEALAFGEVVLISIPYGSLQGFGEQYGSQLSGKIVMETGI
jgi:lactate dehydrogenase-like 2-hydroxyacid dehydrogenase